jgi:hypothetical protein
MTKIEMQMVGRERDRATVELEDEDDCAHCQFVQENVGYVRGGAVSFVCKVSDPANTIRRVEVLAVYADSVALECEAVTEEQAAKELASHSVDLGRRTLRKGKRRGRS